jgi:hypothetical protein
MRKAVWLRKKCTSVEIILIFSVDPGMQNVEVIALMTQTRSAFEALTVKFLHRLHSPSRVPNPLLKFAGMHHGIKKKNAKLSDMELANVMGLGSLVAELAVGNFLQVSVVQTLADAALVGQRAHRPLSRQN